MGDEKKTKKFRLKAKAIALTYSQIGTNEPDLKIWEVEIVDKLPEIIGYCIAKEKHAIKGWHIHAWINFKEQLETENCKRFDIMGHHPNVKPAARAPIGWIKYIKKDGKWIEYGTIPKQDESKNYIRKKADKLAWEMDELKKNLKQIKWPIVFKNIAIPKPDPSTKQRHWYIWGSTTIGKTKAAQDIAEGKKVYMAPTDRNGRWDDYDDEELVILDDTTELSDYELNEVCETWRVLKPKIYGQRNYTRYWKMGITRTIIIISNDRPKMTPKFTARFNVAKLENEEIDIHTCDPYEYKFE